jgi:amidase
MVGRYAHRIDAGRDRMTAHLLGQVDDGLKMSLKQVTEAERLRTAYWHRVRALLTHHDYIITPTIGAPAFLLDEPLPTTVGGKKLARYYDVYRYTYAFSVVGLPVTAVPCGFTREGLPVGLQIVARRMADESALEAAAAYTSAHPEFVVTPGRLGALQ